jgi:hypothetical protein
LRVSFPAARSLTLLSLANPLLSFRYAHPGGRDAAFAVVQGRHATSRGGQFLPLTAGSSLASYLGIHSPVTGD